MDSDFSDMLLISGFSHHAEKVVEWTGGRGVERKWKVLDESWPVEHLHVVKPIWAGFEIFLESHVSEEKFGVSVHGGHELRGSDDFTDLFDFGIEGRFVWVLEAPQIPKSLTNFDAVIFGKGVQVRAMPFIWEITWVSGAELASKWPFWGFFFISMLIIVR